MRIYIYIYVFTRTVCMCLIYLHALLHGTVLATAQLASALTSLDSLGPWPHRAAATIEKKCTSKHELVSPKSLVLQLAMVAHSAHCGCGIHHALHHQIYIYIDMHICMLHNCARACLCMRIPWPGHPQYIHPSYRGSALMGMGG